MFKLAKLAATLAFAMATGAVLAQDVVSYEGIGREATANEVAAWDIDVRPDFKGLPKGSGTVADGMMLWEAQCASCHGVFGESNEVFTPIVGGTTEADQESGRVASLTNPAQPQRTSLMKVSTVSTLYDYIYRAMPWNAPRSLSADDTYAVLAYILNLGYIVPDDFTLSDANMAEVQAIMPNRNGMTTDHGLWTVDGKPDVTAKACMSDCVEEVVVSSSLPDSARNAHYNLAEQNRTFGPYRGVNTTKPPLQALPGADYQPVVAMAQTAEISPKQLFTQNNCAACHAAASPMVGPSIQQVAQKYKDQPDVWGELQTKVKQGGVGTWGSIPMPPHPQVSDEDITVMIEWMMKGS